MMSLTRSSNSKAQSAKVVVPEISHDVRSQTRTVIRNELIRPAIEFSNSHKKNIPAYAIPVQLPSGEIACDIHLVKPHPFVREWKFYSDPYDRAPDRVIAFCTLCGNIVKCNSFWFNDMDNRMDEDSIADDEPAEEVDAEPASASAPPSAPAPDPVVAPTPTPTPAPVVAPVFEPPKPVLFQSAFSSNSYSMSMSQYVSPFQFQPQPPAIESAAPNAPMPETESNPDCVSVESRERRNLAYDRVRCKCDHMAQSAFLDDEVFRCDMTPEGMNACIAIGYLIDRNANEYQYHNAIFPYIN